MDEETNKVSKVLYSVLIILICIVLMIYVIKKVVWFMYRNYIG